MHVSLEKQVEDRNKLNKQINEYAPKVFTIFKPYIGSDKKAFTQTGFVSAIREQIKAVTPHWNVCRFFVKCSHGTVSVVFYGDNGLEDSFYIGYGPGFHIEQGYEFTPLKDDYNFQDIRDNQEVCRKLYGELKKAVNECGPFGHGLYHAHI